MTKIFETVRDYNAFVASVRDLINSVSISITDDGKIVAIFNTK